MLADFLRRSTLFPKAESRAASLGGEDILNTPGVSIEVKATAQMDLTGALRQAHRNAPVGALPMVVYRPRGYGEAALPQWLAVVSLEDMMALLWGCGYAEDKA